MMNEHGVSLSRNTGMQTKQVQVIKCKACGEILSEEHNYHYTRRSLLKLQPKKKIRQSGTTFLGIICVFALMALLFLTLPIAIAIDGAPAGKVGAMLILPLFCAGMAWWSRPSKFK